MASIYFKTDRASETGVKMQNLIDKGKTIQEEILKYVKELGGTEYYLRSGRSVFHTGIIGVEFKDQPDMKIWKKFPDYIKYYKPRLSSKIGKEIDKKLQSFERIEKEDINEVIGLSDFVRFCGFGNGSETFGFQTDSEWNHTMPEDCIEITFTEYKKLFSDEN